jgi:CDP-4-dehydro-6-deoxyglucose reductase, E1
MSERRVLYATAVYDQDEINVAERLGLVVIEDSFDAIGPKLRGTPTGTRSDISVTSFSLSHIITAAGQGGMVMLDDRRLATGASRCGGGDGGPSR